MVPNVDPKVYNKCIELWGKESQLDMMIEECSEMIMAIQHLRRKKCDENEVIQEIADVVFMAHQLCSMFGEDKVKEALNFKVERLKNRMRDRYGVEDI